MGSSEHCDNESKDSRGSNGVSSDTAVDITKRPKPYAEMEYSALRAEILKRIELRQQLMAITLTISGAFLGFGLNSAPIALVYPPLATFLAFGWAQNDYRIRDLADYIRTNFESSIPGLGWETFMQKKRPESGLGSWRRFVILSHGGIFLFTQLMAMGIGLSRFASFTSLEWVLLGVDVVFAVAVLGLLRQARR